VFYQAHAQAASRNGLEISNGFYRQKFTLAHELGHHFLGHSNYLAKEYCQEEDFIDIRFDSSLKPVKQLEWQANHFAACLLLPRSNFMADFLSLAEGMGLKDRGHGWLYVDNQPCNVASYHKVVNSLLGKYRVSKSVIKIRLEQFNFLTYRRNDFSGLSGMTQLLKGNRADN
jgi:hypothetical protein